MGQIYNTYICEKFNKSTYIIAALAVSGATIYLLYMYVDCMMGAMVLQFNDENIFANAITSGTFPPLKFAGSGRFAPLSFQDNRPILFSGLDTNLIIKLLYTYNATKLVAFIALIWLILKKSTNLLLAGATCLCILLFIPSKFHHFYSLIFPENTIIMLLGIWILSFYLAYETDKLMYYFVAFIAGVFAAYMKETAFLLFSSASCVVLLLNYSSITRRARIFHVLNIFSIVIFLTLYYLIVFRHATSFYNTLRIAGGFLDTLFFYLKGELVLRLGLLGIWGRTIHWAIERKIAHKEQSSHCERGMI